MGTKNDKFNESANNEWTKTEWTTKPNQAIKRGSQAYGSNFWQPPNKTVSRKEHHDRTMEDMQKTKAASGWIPPSKIAKTDNDENPETDKKPKGWRPNVWIPPKLA